MLRTTFDKWLTLARLLSKPGAVDLDALAPGALADLLRASRVVRDIGKRIEERAREVARSGGLPGWILHLQSRVEIAGDVAHAVLVERFGAEVADQACRLTTSQMQIEDAIRGMAQRQREAGEEMPRGWQTQETRATLAEIRGRGGVTDKPIEVLKETGGRAEADHAA